MAKNPPTKPFLLRVAMVMGGAFGSFGTLLGAWALVSLLTEEGPFLVNDVATPKAAFLRLALPILAVYILACFTAGAASLALWRNRARSRLLLSALLAEFVLGDSLMLVVMHRALGTSVMDLAASAASFVLLVGLSLWYLFGKQSVVQYYGALEPKPAPDGAP